MIFLNTHVDDQKIRWRSQKFFNDWLGQSAEVVHDLFYLFIYFIYLLVALKLKIELYIYFSGDKDWRYTYVQTLPIWLGDSRSPDSLKILPILQKSLINSLIFNSLIDLDQNW